MVFHYPSCPTGDVSLSAEDKPPFSIPRQSTPLGVLGDDLRPLDTEDDEDDDHYYDEEDDYHIPLDGRTALKFLLAGGIAGAGELNVLLLG
jgi:solute carrier family 25 phosphate transporter 23/24/25/41